MTKVILGTRSKTKTCQFHAHGCLRGFCAKNEGYALACCQQLSCLVTANQNYFFAGPWSKAGRLGVEGGGGERVCSAASVYTAQLPTYHVIIAAVGNSYQARGAHEISFRLRVGPVVGLLAFEG